MAFRFTASRISSSDRLAGPPREAFARVNPQYAIAYSNRGNAFLNKKDYALAIKDYNEAIRINPSDAASYGRRAMACGKRRDWDKAVADYEKVMSLAAKPAWVVRDFALLRATCPAAKYRDGNKAVELATKAVEFQGPSANWEYHAALAAALAEAGQFDKAIVSQKKALEDKSLDGAIRDEAWKRLKLYEGKKAVREE